MADFEKIKTAFERNAKALTLRPNIGQGTAVTKVQVLDGLTCEIEEGKWKFIADLGEKHGGNDQGPNPGVLGRAALGSCLAMGYMRWAAKLGVPVTELSVEIQADYDARGEYAVEDRPADYTEIRYKVTVKSPAPETDILKVIEMSDSHSSFFDIFARPQNLKREVEYLAEEN